MGEIPHFHMEMDKLASNFGELAASGKAYLASLSSDSSDTSLMQWLREEKMLTENYRNKRLGSLGA